MPKLNEDARVARTGLEVSVQKMRFKTIGGADVTDDVRQALLRIVRISIHARCYLRLISLPVAPLAGAGLGCPSCAYGGARRTQCLAGAPY